MYTSVCAINFTNIGKDIILILFQKELEESEKKFQSTQGRLKEFAALKEKLSNMEAANKDLEASKEVCIPKAMILHIIQCLLCYCVIVESDW